MTIKKMLAVAVFALSVAWAQAQDVILFKDGSKRYVRVETVVDQKVRFRDYHDQNSPLYETPISVVESITYKSGYVDTFSKDKSNNPAMVYQATDAVSEAEAAQSNNVAPGNSVMHQADPYANMTLSQYVALEKQETTLRRLKVWSKICKIYGWVSLPLGILCLRSANTLEEEDYKTKDDYDNAVLRKRITGIGAMVEGIAALSVGYSLQAKRNRLIREYNAVSMAPLFEHEFKLNDNLSMTPSVNVISNRNSAFEGVGAGLSFRF